MSTFFHNTSVKMSGGTNGNGNNNNNNPFLPEDLFGLVLCFLVEDRNPYDVRFNRKLNHQMLSLRSTCKAWRDVVDSKYRVFVPFIDSGTGYDRNVPAGDTLPPFVLPTFRHMNLFYSSNTAPCAVDAIEGYASFNRQHLSGCMLTRRHNLQVLCLDRCRWDERTVLHSNPALEIVRISNCHDGIEVSKLPNLRSLSCNNHDNVDLGPLDIHSLDSLETLSVEVQNHKQHVVYMDPAPEAMTSNSIYVEPFKTVRTLTWNGADICKDERCWEWTRSIEQVSLEWVPLTKISGPLQIVKLEIISCNGLLEIDLPEDAPTKRVSIRHCSILQTVKSACRLHYLDIKYCEGLERISAKVFRDARLCVIGCRKLRDVGN